MSESIIELASGAQGLFIKNTRFNTTLISFNFYMPLKEKTVAQMALLPFVLTTCSEKYPDFSRLNYKLSKLYGAQLSASAEKVGDFQLLKMAISVIDDRYALDGEELTSSAVELLTSLVFEPKVLDCAFCEEDVEREKRKAIEHIRGELSEKRVYARGRMIEEMYKGEPYGLPKCGTEEQVAKIDGADLYTAWQEMLSHAFLRVNVSSRTLPSGFFDNLSQRLSEIDRSTVTDLFSCTATKPAKEVNTVTERMDITQGKLVMGFSSETYGDDSKTMPLYVMCDIFGGGPYSRLFTNVREKLSLCYYCSASSVRIKGFISVDSGVEAQNAEKAQQEILNQLDIMKKGEFTDFEFESSIKSIADSLKSYNDSQETLDAWYSIKIFERQPISPEEAKERLDAVDRNAVTAAANGVELHTVYRLLPKEETQ